MGCPEDERLRGGPGRRHPGALRQRPREGLPVRTHVRAPAPEHCLHAAEPIGGQRDGGDKAEHERRREGHASSPREPRIPPGRLTGRLHRAKEGERGERDEVRDEAVHEHVEESEGRRGEEREVPQPSILARGSNRHPASPEDEEARPPAEVQDERVARGPRRVLRARERLVPQVEAQVLHHPDPHVGREMRMEEESERHAERRVQDHAPVCPLLDPDVVDEEENTESEERLERGVGERVQPGDDAEPYGPPAARERDGDQDEQEREGLGPQPDHAQHEVGRAAEDEERDGDAPASDGGDGAVGQRGRDQRAEECEGDEPARGRVGEDGERDEQHVEQELLVAEAVVHDAEAGPLEAMEQAPLRVGPRHRQVVVGIAVWQHRQAHVEQAQNERRGREDQPDAHPECGA